MSPRVPPQGPETTRSGGAHTGGRAGRTYRPNHFADQDDGGPPSRAGRQDPATVQLEQELRTGVDVHAGPVLPAGMRDGGPGHSVSGARRTRPQQVGRRTSSNCSKAKAGGDLELTGDVGGDTGVGTSVSSSSSSSHSSSLRGVMLFPSHTEWMDTFNRQGHPGHRSGARRRVLRPGVLSCWCGGVLGTEPTPVTRQGPFSASGSRAGGPADWGRGFRTARLKD